MPLTGMKYHHRKLLKTTYSLTLCFMPLPFKDHASSQEPPFSQLPDFSGETFPPTPARRVTPLTGARFNGSTSGRSGPAGRRAASHGHRLPTRRLPTHPEPARDATTRRNRRESRAGPGRGCERPQVASSHGPERRRKPAAARGDAAGGGGGGRGWALAGARNRPSGGAGGRPGSRAASRSQSSPPAPLPAAAPASGPLLPATASRADPRAHGDDRAPSPPRVPLLQGRACRAKG